MADFNFSLDEEDDDTNGNFSLDEYTDQERHFAEPAFIQPEPPPPEPKVVEQVLSGAKKIFAGDDSIDSEGNYLLISEDELKARAKMQTKIIKGYIETGVTFFNSVLILKKGDNMAFEGFEAHRKSQEEQGLTVEIEPDSELAKLLERMNKYRSSEETSKVDNIEEKLLLDAILADLRSQNKAKMLARLSKWEAVRDIALSKIAPNVQDKFLQGVQTIINKF